MIREFKADDIESLMTIWRSASEQCLPFLSPECLDQTEPYVRFCIEAAADGSTVTFVSLVNRKPIAFITISDGEVLLLYVAPNSQKMGIGERLLKRAKTIFESLTLKVHVKNTSGIRFYERNGFMPSEGTTVDSCNEQQLVMSWQR